MSEIVEKISLRDELTLREAIRIINQLSSAEQLQLEITECADQEDLQVKIFFQNPQTLFILGRLHEQLKTKYELDDVLLTVEDIIDRCKIRPERHDQGLRIVIMRIFWLLGIIMVIFILLLTMSQPNVYHRKNQLLKKDIPAYYEGIDSSIYKSTK